MACSVASKNLPCPVASRPVVACVLVLASVLMLAGCGGNSDVPDLGRVTGVVTLDGQPLSGAQVTFSPESGRPSNAETDKDGSYSLQFTADEAGAILGKHTVKIATAVDGRDDPKTERVPSRYNSKTELTAEVKEGKNTLDFELSSK